MAGGRAGRPADALVTVTDVRVTEDLHHASVFFTVLGDDAAGAAEAWLASSAPRPGPSWPRSCGFVMPRR